MWLVLYFIVGVIGWIWMSTLHLFSGPNEAAYQLTLQFVFVFVYVAFCFLIEMIKPR